MGQLEHGALVGVADVDRPGQRRVEQGQQPGDLVFDEAEAAGLVPSPYTVSGSPRSAWTMKFDTTRPSPGAAGARRC